MADDSDRKRSDGVSRRKFVVASGAMGATALAGCTGGGGGGGGGNGGGNGSGGGGNDSGGNMNSSGQAAAGGPLTADGSSTVYPITSQAASVWNSNPPADDEEYWGPGQYNIDTNKALASYWAGLYGFSASNEGQPPFFVNVGLSHSGTGVTKLMQQQVDIGDSSAPVEDELPDADQATLDKFVDHVVGVDGQPIMVSKPIKDAGVDLLTGDELRGIYSGDIQQWSEIQSYSGPDKEIQAICRAEGSGTDTSFRSNLYGDPNAPIDGCDARIGQNQQVRTTVINSDNAIAYAALAFVGGQAPAISLRLNGTTYTPGENLGQKGYPLARDLHAYTWQDTSKKEAAFLRMILSPYGQQNFVAANDYFKLPDDRIEQQLNKLPDPSGGSGGSDNSSNSSG